jgi:mono/diheme cytochrome c family protein
MKSLLLLLAPLALAQSGADIFAKSCASGYCHGVRGEGAGGPKLANRGFDEAYITSVVRSGIPGTAMQAYGQTFTRPEFAAVVAYVASLNGISSRTEAPAPLSPEAAAGRALFSDPLKGFTRCSTCHEAGAVGIPVAPLTKSEVKQIAIGADRFPGLVVTKGGRRVSVWDLSISPPVLRSADTSAVTIGNAAQWTHPSSYSPAEMEKVNTFLKAVH